MVFWMIVVFWKYPVLHSLVTSSPSWISWQLSWPAPVGKLMLYSKDIFSGHYNLTQQFLKIITKLFDKGILGLYFRVNTHISHQGLIQDFKNACPKQHSTNSSLSSFK